MAYELRIESKKHASFLTTKSRNSELWLVNNKSLEDSVLGFAAKYRERYGVKLYALLIEGNQIQGPAFFPKLNRADFMRDFNSSVARAVPKYVRQFPGGHLWAKRYSCEFLPGAEDLENWFFSTVLKPVQDGLVEKISDYPGYNSFSDAIHGTHRTFKVLRLAEYNTAKRHGRKVHIKDFIDIVTLKYERLPGYEKLSKKEYAALMMKKLEEKRVSIVKDRLSKGLGFIGKDALLKLKPGALPPPHAGTPEEYRPKVLSISPKRKAKCDSWYLDICLTHKEASRRYRLGELNVKFPPGTYRPYSSSRAVGVT